MPLEGRNLSFGAEHGFIDAVDERHDIHALWPLAIVAALVVATYCSNKILGNRGASRDACFLFLLSAFFCRHALFQAILHVANIIEDVWLYVLPLLAINGLQLLYLSTPQRQHATAYDTSTKHLPLKPLIFPASTAHTRMFPRYHSFKYSYLLVGVPIGWRGGIGNVFGCDEHVGDHKPRQKRPWFSVHAEDYLFYSRSTALCRSDEGKASHTPSLREKLDAYLRSEGVDPTGYPHAYLVTAPRVLGFSFNPVSFWYLYNSRMSLAAMILEVNNTFGERRMYFLPATDDDDNGTGINRNTDTVSTVSTAKFKSKWNKDFHVSPFNDREGVYSLSATDPFASSSATGTVSHDIKINNIITLSSPRYETLSPSPPTTALSTDDPSTSPLQTKLSPKIIASITSTSPVSPSDLHSSPFTLLKFILQHLWIGFMTNPRILHEARKLWGKGLTVWFRPEPKVSTVGREETGEERVVEAWFRVWLQGVVKCSERVSVEYWPAAGADRGRMMIIGTSGEKEEEEEEEREVKHVEKREIELKILTPEFYSELIRHPSMLAVWRDRCFNPKEGEAMVYIAPEDMQIWEEILGDYLEKYNCKEDAGQGGSVNASRVSNGSTVSKLVDDLSSGKPLLRSLLSAVLGKITSVLRHQNHNTTTLKTTTPPPPSPPTTTTKIGSGLSFRDLMHNLHPPPSQSQPQSSTLPPHSTLTNSSLTILLADRLAFSSTTLLRFYGTLIRSTLLIWAASRISGIWVVNTNTSMRGTGVESEFEGKFQLGTAADLGMMLRLSEAAVLIVTAAGVGRVSN